MTEMLMACKEYGVKVISKIVNKIYNIGNIPEEMRKSIFIAILKKPQAKEYS